MKTALLAAVLASACFGQTRLHNSQVQWGGFPTSRATRVDGSQLSARGIGAAFVSTLECVDHRGAAMVGPNVQLLETALLFTFMRGNPDNAFEPSGVPAEVCPDGLMWGDSPTTPKSDSEITPCVSTRAHVRQVLPKYSGGWSPYGSCSRMDRWGGS